MQVRSGVAVRAWKVLDFALLRLFDIAILATRTVLKHLPKPYITPSQTLHYGKSFILKEKQVSVRLIHS